MPLEPPDQQYLQSEDGFIELGMFEEANEELEKIDPFVRAPSQLSAKAILYRSGREWTTVGILAHLTYPTVIRVMLLQNAPL